MGGLRTKALEHAIARFYDAVADPAQWPSAIDTLARAMDAEGGVVLNSGPGTSMLGGHSALIGVMETYERGGWHAANPRAAITAFMKAGRFIADHDLLDGRDFARDHYYQEFLKPQGLMWSVATGLWTTETDEPVIMTLERSAQAGRFSADELEGLDRIRGDLVRALTLTRALGFRRLDAMMGAWEAIDQAIALLDSAGRLFRATRTFSAAIGDGLSLKGSRLVADHPWDTAALDAAILDMVRIHPVTTGTATGLTIRRASQRAPLVLDLMAVPRDWETLMIGARAIVLLRDPERIRPARPDLLRNAFSLSRREAELAALLARGLDLGEAAAKLGVARPTVRSQLAALFAKTGTRRQAELVALLTRYAGNSERQSDADRAAEAAVRTPLE